jgi:hypothetical protein
MRVAGNSDLRRGSDFRYALVADQHHLIGQHLAGPAVEQTAGANGYQA